MDYIEITSHADFIEIDIQGKVRVYEKPRYELVYTDNGRVKVVKIIDILNRSVVADYPYSMCVIDYIG